VAAVALAVDLAPELDGDQSYPIAARAAAAATDLPVVVLANLPGAIDQATAASLRADGIPVLEGMRTGLLALRHLIDHAARQGPHDHEGFRTAGGLTSFMIMEGPGPMETRAALGLLREYGISTARVLPAASEAEALAAATEIGYPIVLKTGEPAIAHKTEARGVILGLSTPEALAAAYRDLAARLGPRALVFETVPPGPELSLGLARDPDLGPLIVVAAGGTLVELLDDKAVALPPVSEPQAAALLGTLRASRLLDGVRGAPPASRDAVVRAITALSALAADLGDRLEALDINPLICGPATAVAVDALLIPRR
jgi:acyl-CoA synthetase (NDP forming)